MTDPNLIAEAIAWHGRGAMPIPIAPDGHKRPGVRTWRQWQAVQAPLVDVIAAFRDNDTDGIGLICGVASGNLEMLELEGRAVDEGYLERMAAAFADHGRAALLCRVLDGYAELTPSGGIHWYYRIAMPDGILPPASRRLASRPATEAEHAASGEKRKVLIETRGQGGFTVIAPSGGRSHPSGLSYVVQTGSPADIPTLTVAEHDTLHAILSCLDQMPDEASEDVAPARPRQPGDPLRPGDDYNRRASWDDLLVPRGWTVVQRHGLLTTWVRPGKSRHEGISATTGRNEADNLYVFSTGTDFVPEKPYSKFSAYALLEHGGDHSAAAKALAADGYGDQAPRTPLTLEGRLGEQGPFGGVQSQQASNVIQLRPSPPRTDGTAALATVHVAQPAVHQYGPTEDGMARALVAQCAPELRYCPQRHQWLTWDGSRWSWDEVEHHRELIRGIARTLPEDKEWVRFKTRALSSQGVAGIARLAQTDPAVVVHIDQLDARPWELNTPSGALDLRTGGLLPADREALHTRSTTVAPDADLEAPAWTRFLETTFGGDRQLVGFVQRLVGLAFVGKVHEQILPFMQGAGANGKSTFMETLQAIGGVGQTGYTISAASEMLMVRRHSEHPAELAQLVGARLVVCSEIDDGQRFAEARIKQLTGGDSINARVMRGNPFTFTPSHTLFLVGNHKPNATVGGPAFWRRLKLILFGHIVPENERDPRLLEKLLAEGPAILSWIAAGAAAYHEGGLGTPDSVTRATEAYEADQDSIGKFVAEACHLAPGQSMVQTKVTALREAYERFCHELGDEPASARRLTQELRDRFGVESTRTKSARFYTGIALIDNGLDDNEREW